MSAPNPAKPYPDPVEGLAVTVDDGVVRIVIDRPARRNMFTDDMVLALTDTVDAAGSDGQARVVVISATGEHFCAGFDLSERTSPSGPTRAGEIQRRMRWHVGRLIPALLEVQTPVVCQVHGAASGLGLAIALAADFTVASDDAKFIAPFVGLGFTPDSGVSWLLPRLVGLTRAKQMLMLGRRVRGHEAADCGMIHQAVPAEQLAEATEALVAELRRAPTVAVGLSKTLIHRGLSVDLARHLADEGQAMELSSRSEDFREAARAAAERRPPDFTGR